MSSAASDFVVRFLFEALDIRGAFVRLDDAWRSLQAGRGYAATVRELLGEMTATAAIIAGNLKQPGRLTFQLQGHGPVRMLVIDCSAELHLRGMAQAAAEVAPAPLSQLFGDGRLALILQNEAAREPWQSLVPVCGDSIAAIFEHYLVQSEQQPARLWLAADEGCACGLFLQKLPGADARDADGWSRIELLAGTVTPQEMRDLSAEMLLRRLFPGEDVRLFAPKPVAYDCPEDRDKVCGMLRSLGRAEAEAILAEQGEIVVRDDICNREYRFDAADLDALFPQDPPAPRTLH
ncbi:MAG: Hsp33 family molecular chaperone HslO [Zoogloeaceae bacterium]|nr:Hsp33 family molecular chaperone HslO [Zoogloeaceae bacterium]MCK6383820.1 Hsp33 family molecular chaperone HslO [Rhodocyclaceae bacterium]